MTDRNNKRLNREIERRIDIWYGTVYGWKIENMYRNGSSYEAICECAGIDYEEYEEG